MKALVMANTNTWDTRPTNMPVYVWSFMKGIAVACPGIMPNDVFDGSALLPPAVVERLIHFYVTKFHSGATRKNNSRIVIEEEAGTARLILERAPISSNAYSLRIEF